MGGRCTVSYTPLEILQSLAQCKSNAQVFISNANFRAELWIWDGELKRIVTAKPENLMLHLTEKNPVVVLNPLENKRFLEHNDAKIDLNELVMQAARMLDENSNKGNNLKKITSKQPGAKARFKRISQSVFRPDVILSPAQPLFFVHGNDSEIIIGRSASCNIRAGDESTSRQHCRIHFNDGVLEIEDLGSTNGTYVNGMRVTRYCAAHGDFVRVGSHVFVIHIAGA